MRDGVHDVRTDGVAAALCAPKAASAWEVLRRLGRPADARELAVALKTDPAQVQQVLDALSDAGILEKLPIRSNRRQPNYRANGESLAVAYDPSDGDESERIRRIAAALRAQVESSIARDFDWSDDSTLCAWRTVQLDADERAEFHRLVQEVLDFVESAQARIAKTSETEAGRANVHLLIEARSASPGAPPVPAVHFVPRSAIQGFGRASVAATMAPLSPREREVALMLANGHSRPEIAAQLGVSGNTVATLSKRIYRKLGVRRRVELSNRLRRGGG